MAQPPPRKVKHNALLRKIHSEQLSKLQQKHQLESELLEDIRTFTKERAAIEKHYAQALCKLAQQYLTKKHQFPPSGDNKEGHKNRVGRTLNTVWKTVLEETDRVGRSRLTGADAYSQAITESIKPVKSTKGAAAKKAFEQTGVIQKEVNTTVTEMMRAHKVYSDDEHFSHEARVKANEVDEKIKNKNTGVFTTMSSLQKNSQKLNAKLEVCEVKSTSSRNEYLLNLAAANAHQIHYYSNDIPNLLQQLDGEMYERIRDCFIVFARTELECCGLTQECFTKIMSDSGLISRQYNLDCFLRDNLVFTDLTQYCFEPMDSDPEELISADHQAEEQVQAEARKWATKLAKETNALRQYSRKLLKVQEEILNKTGESEKKEEEKHTPLDLQVEELLSNIRKSETAKCKAEARLEALRMGGVGVDEWLRQAHAESYVEEEEELEEEVAPRSSTSMSMKSDSSHERTASGSMSLSESRQEQEPAASQVTEEPSWEPSRTSVTQNDSTYINYQEEEEDIVDDAFQQGAPSLPAHVAHVTTPPGEDPTVDTSTSRTFPMKCMAIYEFEASNGDEVSLTEGEHLQIVGDGEGDGWVKAMREDGSTGLIPENYVQYFENGAFPDDNEVNVDGDLPVTMEQDVSYNTAERVSAYSATDYEVQNTMTPEEEPQQQEPVAPPVAVDDGPWVRALYDYEATSEEELSFHEGQFIRIIRKDESEVDDGWWEGTFDGRTGVFPSLVVEEIMAGGDGSGPGGMLSPAGAGPPAFTPPEPGPLPPQLEVTQPTPTDEHAQALQGCYPSHPVYAHWTHYRPRESTV